MAEKHHQDIVPVGALKEVPSHSAERGLQPEVAAEKGRVSEEDGFTDDGERLHDDSTPYLVPIDQLDVHFSDGYDFSTRGAEMVPVEPHRAFTQEEIDEILRLRDEKKKMHCSSVDTCNSFHRSHVPKRQRPSEKSTTSKEGSQSSGTPPNDMVLMFPPSVPSPVYPIAYVPPTQPQYVTMPMMVLHGAPQPIDFSPLQPQTSLPLPQQQQQELQPVYLCHVVNSDEATTGRG
uniref:Uncharacterized protein TCIL3000_5_1810 n=1 Tax=Trypanosoma congolense (strain IL3000) TaxID=1068625 RepID=G0UMR9_TRYCI|nr:unnamed protein product [Trypanosoma congolense IL3000]